MNDHSMVQALHAAISRRNWQEVEQAANRIRDDREIKWPCDHRKLQDGETCPACGRMGNGEG